VGAGTGQPSKGNEAIQRAYTHFSDNDGTSNAHWRPGKIDWKGVLQALRDVGYDHVISIELEDVPGVAHPGQPSTEALDWEVLLSKDYLSDLCQDLEIAIET